LSEATVATPGKLLAHSDCGQRGWGMTDPVIGSFPVKYTGLISDEHLIDLQEFGASLQGLAKISNSAVDFYLHGKIAKPRQYQVRLFAAPAEPQCVLLEIVGLMAAGQLPLYAPLLCHMTTEYLVPLIKAMIFKRLKRPDLMEKTLDQLQEVTAQNHEFAKLVHGGQQQDKAWLQAHIDKLAAQNSGAFRQLVSPVGSTCSLIQIGTPDHAGPLMITEAEAEVLTSREELVVEDAKKYQGVFNAVDQTNGICKFLIKGEENWVAGKITDPALQSALNPYTHSLDTQTLATITAKAVMKDGEIKKLYISDGKATNKAKVR
jgi:hypothetical protein